MNTTGSEPSIGQIQSEFILTGSQIFRSEIYNLFTLSE
jgi:hypothetical protein